jgi:tetratricopeptide (TPR) repeat protein
MNAAFVRQAGLKTWLLFASFLFIASVAESASEKTAVDNGYLIAAHDQNTAVAVAAGEFRIVVANVIWSDVVDHYHHRYIAEGGDWSKNPTILPLLKTIIALDPHFVEAYETLGTILYRRGGTSEGEAVLSEGIRYNPDHWELYREMALMYAKDDNWDRALPYGQQGLKLADDDFSRNLMGMLVHSVQQRIAKEHSAATLESQTPQAARQS